MRKRIVCFGDSNTWGYDAAVDGRFSEDVRWPKQLARLMDDAYEIVEEGLSGRTSVCDDPLFEGLNGLSYIAPCLMSHSPLEAVIIMLGTNDTKERFHLTSYNIAQGIVRLAMKARDLPVWHDQASPKVLVVAPPTIGKGYEHSPVGAAMGHGCHEKSVALAEHLSTLLPDDIAFLNTQDVIEMNTIDYMHLTEEGHKLLAEFIFDKLKKVVLPN